MNLSFKLLESINAFCDALILSTGFALFLFLFEISMSRNNLRKSIRRFFFCAAVIQFVLASVNFLQFFSWWKGFHLAHTVVNIVLVCTNGYLFSLFMLRMREELLLMPSYEDQKKKTERLQKQLNGAIETIQELARIDKQRQKGNNNNDSDQGVFKAE